MLSFGVRQGSVLSALFFAVYINDLIMSFPNNCGIYAILYADDILLISPTVCMLQNMFTICELELQALDLVINPKKSSCIRIGPRNDITCVRICSSSGVLLPWVKEMKYLGVAILSCRNFKISTEESRRAFHRTANAEFAASAELPQNKLCCNCCVVNVFQFCYMVSRLVH